MHLSKYKIDFCCGGKRALSVAINELNLNEAVVLNSLEEAYEVVAAIDKNDIAGIKEELGDLMLLILLQAQIATDDKEFNILEVLQDVNRKIVRRHPHVFGSLRVQNDGEILENWERLKEKDETFCLHRHPCDSDGVCTQEVIQRGGRKGPSVPGPSCYP